jgi:hypothetical protein
MLRINQMMDVHVHSDRGSWDAFGGPKFVGQVKLAQLQGKPAATLAIWTPSTATGAANAMR